MPIYSCPTLTPRPELDDDWDPQLRDLLQGMLKKDPHERATVAHIRVSF
jgi:serine/threonine protein kinase